MTYPTQANSRFPNLVTLAALGACVLSALLPGCGSTSNDSNSDTMAGIGGGSASTTSSATTTSSANTTSGAGTTTAASTTGGYVMDCYSPPLTRFCANGDGIPRCYPESSFRYMWPLDADPAEGAAGATAEEVPFCPPGDVIMRTQNQGPCGNNLVEVCTEGEQVGDECCYDGIYYTAMSCCG